MTLEHPDDIRPTRVYVTRVEWELEARYANNTFEYTVEFRDYKPVVIRESFAIGLHPLKADVDDTINQAIETVKGRIRTLTFEQMYPLGSPKLVWERGQYK